LGLGVLHGSLTPAGSVAESFKMASGNHNLTQRPLWGSSTFNIGINLPGMPSGLGTQQQAKPQQKAPGAGLKAKNQVIVEDDDDVSVLVQQVVPAQPA
jgi:hypothetical protein